MKGHENHRASEGMLNACGGLLLWEKGLKPQEQQLQLWTLERLPRPLLMSCGSNPPSPDFASGSAAVCMLTQPHNFQNMTQIVQQLLVELFVWCHTARIPPRGISPALVTEVCRAERHICDLRVSPK